MSALLDLARSRQAHAAATAPINAEDALIAQRARAMAIASSRPMGLAVLAWCQEHPAEVGIHAELVENLRRALALQERIGSHLLALACEVPGVALIQPAKAKG